MAVFTGKDFWGWVQFADGLEVYPLGRCTTIDTLTDPRTGTEPILCLDAEGNYVQDGEMLTAPSQPTFAVTELIEKAASYMEQIKEARCRFNFYVTASDCGKRSVWTNRERVFVYRNARILDSPVNTPRTMDTDAKVEYGFNMTAWIGRGDHRPLTAARISTSETVALNDIQACSGRCADGCGSRIEICQVLWVAADAVPAAIPDVLYSNDSGATWTSPASGFAADENIMADACVEVDADTTRLITVRDADVANPLEIGYSDDNAVTWTMVNVGATNAEAAVGGGSMFALDADNIWICTDDGRVFYSSDAAVTWTDQTTALAASGANALNAIHFADSNVGYAVGASDTVIRTLDGGDNWAAMTATGSGDGLNTVHCFNENRVIVGTDSVVSASPVYMSYDGTTNWTTITEGLGIEATDTVEDITFMAHSGIAGLDDLCGYLIKNTSAPVGTVYKSVDGGFSWSAVTTPTNSGLNSIYICNANQAYTVGEVDSATSFIARVNG